MKIKIDDIDIEIKQLEVVSNNAEEQIEKWEFVNPVNPGIFIFHSNKDNKIKLARKVLEKLC